MIVVDTNVVSEPLKVAPSEVVVDWLDAQAPETLFLTSVSLAELLAGVQVLPTGKRRNALASALSDRVLPLFAGRVLPFEDAAAEAFARVHAAARKVGNPIGFADCAIAAIAALRGFAVATRDVRGFRGTGVSIINPWG